MELYELLFIIAAVSALITLLLILTVIFIYTLYKAVKYLLNLSENIVSEKLADETTDILIDNYVKNNDWAE